MRSIKSVLIWLLAVLLFYLILRATVAIGLSPPELLVQAAQDNQCINIVGVAPYVQRVDDRYTDDVSHPACAVGAPDGETANIGRGAHSQLVLDVGQGNEFVDGEGDDLYFFEDLNGQGTGISLDRVRIAVADSVNDQPGEFTPDVFVWGDADATNNGSLTISSTEEIDRDVPLEQLIREDKYGAIGIDLAGKVPAGKVFRYIRIRAFDYGKVVEPNRFAQVDAFEARHPSPPTLTPEIPTTVPLPETPTIEPITPVASTVPPVDTASSTAIVPTDTATPSFETTVTPTATNTLVSSTNTPAPTLTNTATASSTATFSPTPTTTFSPTPTATPDTPTATKTVVSDTVTPLSPTLPLPPPPTPPPPPPSPTQKSQDTPTVAATAAVAVVPSATPVPTIAATTAIVPNITSTPTSTDTAFPLPTHPTIVASDASPTVSQFATISPMPASPTSEATRTPVTTKAVDLSATSQAAIAAQAAFATNMTLTQTAVAEGTATTTAENGLTSTTRNVFQQYSFVRKTKLWARNASNGVGVIIELFLGGFWTFIVYKTDLIYKNIVAQWHNNRFVMLILKSAYFILLWVTTLLAFAIVAALVPEFISISAFEPEVPISAVAVFVWGLLVTYNCYTLHWISCIDKKSLRLLRIFGGKYPADAADIICEHREDKRSGYRSFSDIKAPLYAHPEVGQVIDAFIDHLEGNVKDVRSWLSFNKRLLFLGSAFHILPIPPLLALVGGAGSDPASFMGGSRGEPAPPTDAPTLPKEPGQQKPASLHEDGAAPQELPTEPPGARGAIAEQTGIQPEGQTSEPSSTLAASQRSSNRISFEQKSMLVSALLDCDTMRDRGKREVVLRQLRLPIIRRDTSDITDVVNIVDACLDYEGALAQLVSIVRYFEGDSLPMREVRRVASMLNL